MKNTDLEFFRKILVRQRDELLRRGCSIVSELREKESNNTDPIDMAADYTHQSCALQISHREHQLLRKVNDALDRIQSGEYGCCMTCGEEILSARLKALPVARHCIECKINLENRGKTTFFSSLLTNHGMEADCE